MNKGKVVSSFIFKFIERLAVKGIGLVIGIILARLLAPEIFGLIAIISVFVNLAQTFVQSGLGTALVQNRTADETDYSTVFYLSMGIAVLMIAVLFVVAPLIGRYYDNDALIWPLRVYSFSLLFGALNSVQNAKLQREMLFKTMMRCNLTATVISGAIGVAAAFWGAGLWALVIYYFSNQVIVAVHMMVIQRWYPKRMFSVKRAKELFGFGWKMLISSLLCSLYYDVRSLIIGRRYSAEDLAYYNKAQQYPDLVAKTVSDSLLAVMLPVMASEQERTEQLKKMLLKTIEFSMFCVVPLMAGLAVVSETLIPLLLTDKWVACIPLLRIICVGNMMIPVQFSNLCLLQAVGRSDIYMRAEVVRRIVMIATLLLTVFVFDSVVAIAIGYAAGYWLDAGIIIWYVKHLTGMGWVQQMKATWKSFLAASIMVLVVLPINMISCADILKLLLQVAIGTMTYVFITAVLKSEPLLKAKEIVFKALRKQED